MLTATFLLRFQRLATACETHLDRHMVWDPPRLAKKTVALGDLFW